MRRWLDIPPLRFGLDDKGADAGPRDPAPAPGPFPPDDLGAKNGRRLALIDKHFREGLSASEAGELASLEDEVDQLMQERFPYEGETLARLEKFERDLDAEGVPP